MSNNTYPGVNDLHTAQLVEVVGRLDGTTTHTLGATVERALAAGRSRLILDLSGVEYINSAGLRELVLIFKRVYQQGGSLQIAAPSERVYKVLQLVGLDSLFDITTESPLRRLPLAAAHALSLNRQLCYCL